MLEFLETGKALSVFVAIGVIGIVSKIITRNLYKRLVKETDNMATTKNKNLKILKQKLENAYRLNQNIVNTQAYLDKQVYGFKFMHMSLNGWNNLSLQMTILGLFLGGMGAFLSYWYRLDSYYIILYASVGALGSLFLTFLDSSFNISLKQQRLANALLEYVDNSVFVRAVRETTGRDVMTRTSDVMRTPEMTRTPDVMRNPEMTRNPEMMRTQDMARNSETQESDHSRDISSGEKKIRDGIVRGEERRRGYSGGVGNLRGRNIKAEELLQTVRNMKEDSMEPGDEVGDTERNRRREPDLRHTGTDKSLDQEVRRDIDYLKHSLEQIAASKEKSRINDDWAKNLDAEELKVIGEIMRQYFSGS
ncbi:MAG: hypothetical protein RSC13_00230 [Clostridium sp.]